jgi:hypothetical protein
MGLARNAGLKKSSAQPTRPSSPTSTTKSAQSGHPDRVGECPLSAVKRTSKFKSVTSAFDPKRTSITAICGNAQLCAVDVVALLSPRALRYIFMWSIFMCFIGVGEASAGQSSRYRTSNTTAAYTKV